MPSPQYCILIQAKCLAGERHAEGDDEQQHADHPGELAREFIGAEEKHLNHVNEHECDHEVRAPAVEPANETSRTWTWVIEKKGLQAVPRFAADGHVDEREEKAGHNLEREDRECALPKT